MKPASTRHKPAVLRVVTGHCPTLGNCVRVTLYDNDYCTIERADYNRTQISRHTGQEITETIRFAVLTEQPVKLHTHLIYSLWQPAIWPE